MRCCRSTTITPIAVLAKVSNIDCAASFSRPSASAGSACGMGEDGAVTAGCREGGHCIAASPPRHPSDSPQAGESRPHKGPGAHTTIGCNYELLTLQWTDTAF